MKNKKNHGQSVMEYLLISALIGIFCITAIKDLGERMQSRISTIKKNSTALNVKGIGQTNEPKTKRDKNKDDEPI